VPTAPRVMHPPWPSLNLQTFPRICPVWARFLGWIWRKDHRRGGQRSDQDHFLPLKTLEKTKFSLDAAALFKLMDEREAAGLVIGLPVNMDGTEGTRCQSNRAFARNLLRLREGLLISFWDERLSTVAVNRVLIDEFDASRSRRADLVDQMAAGWILQGALERLRNLQA